MLFYNRPKHTLLYRWFVLYSLYVLAEIAIISTDLAELLGSAMALVMLFPKLPLWVGVLITACDVFVILLVGDPLRRQPVRLFEWLIAAMVCIRSTSYFAAVPVSNDARDPFYIGLFYYDLYARCYHRDKGGLGSGVLWISPLQENFSSWEFVYV